MVVENGRALLIGTLRQEYVTEAAVDAGPVRGVTGAAGEPRRTMPTRAALCAAGREDLLRALRCAGGTLAVAQRLGLWCARRPVGFWDSTDNLDEVPRAALMSLYGLSQTCAPF